VTLFAKSQLRERSGTHFLQFLYICGAMLGSIVVLFGTLCPSEFQYVFCPLFGAFFLRFFDGLGPETTFSPYPRGTPPCRRVDFWGGAGGSQKL